MSYISGLLPGLVSSLKAEEDPADQALRADPGPTRNPYWEQVRRLPGEDITLQYEGRWEPRAFPWPPGFELPVGQPALPDTGPTRDDLCWKYAWAIPDPASLAFLVDLEARLGGRGILELGAGTGYWAWQLNQLGITVVAYDEMPPDRAANHWHRPHRRRSRHDSAAHPTRPVFHPVGQGGAELAAAGPDLTLLLCWPPYATPFADQALAHYAGTRLIYIGEGPGGCCADDGFFARLDADWEEIDHHRPVNWWGIHDWITAYQRKPTSTDMRRP